MAVADDAGATGVLGTDAEILPVAEADSDGMTTGAIFAESLLIGTEAETATVNSNSCTDSTLLMLSNEG